MTFPKVVNDLLIDFNSFKWATEISSFLFIFSDPAKSHKYIFPLVSLPLASGEID